MPARAAGSAAALKATRADGASAMAELRAETTALKAQVSAAAAASPSDSILEQLAALRSDHLRLAATVASLVARVAHAAEHRDPRTVAAASPNASIAATPAQPCTSGSDDSSSRNAASAPCGPESATATVLSLEGDDGNAAAQAPATRARLPNAQGGCTGAASVSLMALQDDHDRLAREVAASHGKLEAMGEALAQLMQQTTEGTTAWRQAHDALAASVQEASCAAAAAQHTAAGAAGAQERLQGLEPDDTRQAMAAAAASPPLPASADTADVRPPATGEESGLAAPGRTQASVAAADHSDSDRLVRPAIQSPPGSHAARELCQATRREMEAASASIEWLAEQQSDCKDLTAELARVVKVLGARMDGLEAHASANRGSTQGPYARASEVRLAAQVASHLHAIVAPPPRLHTAASPSPHRHRHTPQRFQGHQAHGGSESKSAEASDPPQATQPLFVLQYVRPNAEWLQRIAVAPLSDDGGIARETVEAIVGCENVT